MTSITMTEAETETYDTGTEEEQVALMLALHERARALGGVVEIYTADGIVAGVVQ